MNCTSFTMVVMAIAMCMASCTTAYQIFDTKPNSSEIVEGKFYTFENDTVKISYNFWAENGMMELDIYNKLNVPLFIDWKNSSLIRNGKNVSYWINETITSSASRVKSNTGSLFSGYSVNGIAVGNSSSVTPHRISFIAPQSGILRIKVPLKSGDIDIDMTKAARTKLSPNDSKKTVPAKTIEYSSTTSPLAFRNYITYSTSEGFEKHGHVDNAFYVNKVSQIKKKDFGHLVKSGKKKNTMVTRSYFESGRRFYGVVME